MGFCTINQINRMDFILKNPKREVVNFRYLLYYKDLIHKHFKFYHLKVRFNLNNKLNCKYNGHLMMLKFL